MKSSRLTERQPKNEPQSGTEKQQSPSIYPYEDDEVHHRALQVMKDEEHANKRVLRNEGGISGARGPPTRFNSALLNQHNQAVYAAGHAGTAWMCPVCSLRGLHSCMCRTRLLHTTNTPTATFDDQGTFTHWLPMQGDTHAPWHRPVDININNDDFESYQRHAQLATALNLRAPHGRDVTPRFLKLQRPLAGPRSAYAGGYKTIGRKGAGQNYAGLTSEEFRNRALIVNHPLYAQMLTAHAECLRAGTSIEQISEIDAQLAEAPNVLKKYTDFHDQLEVTPEEQMELDHFMVDYTGYLTSFKGVMEQHFANVVTKATMSCFELEKELHSLTGATVGQSNGATMEDGNGDYSSDYGADDRSMELRDSYGSLVPTESERTIMERVRQELKDELKQGYRSKIVDIWEEILRKRGAGKLPEGTTSVLWAWWQAHAKWPYPTEAEKELLMRQTGLELKQVNNWFINQRKRRWHNEDTSTASTSDSAKKKGRKR